MLKPQDGTRKVTPAAWIARGLASSLVLSFAACSLGGPSPSGERTGEAESAVFTNGGFEVGTAGMVPPAPWVLTNFLNPNGVTNPTGTPTYANLNLVAQGAGAACTTNNNCTGVNPQLGTVCTAGHCAPVPLTVELNSATGPGTQTDPTLGAGVSFRWPRYGNRCAIVNQLGNHINVNQLTQSMTVGAGDVDPTDNKVHVRLVVAPVLEDPGHPADQQPYFFVQVINQTQGNAVLYQNFNFSNQPGVPWKGFPTVNPTYRYTDWQLIDVAPGSPAINMGDQIQVVLIAAGCSLGAHMGELYVDGLGSTVPGLFVSGSGPAQVNACNDIAYTLNYKNGSPSQACTTSANCAPNTEACIPSGGGNVCAETGVVITFNTPPGTTYKSMTMPAGATCVTPVVGTAGTITCTFTNPVGPGAAGSFTITVNVPCATAPGQLNCGNYQIGSTQETPLLGNVVHTQIGCSLDSQCPAGNWCNETASSCTATLPNGTLIPTDGPHTNPTLNGKCTAAAGALVCTSGVCDAADNKCGYANGDGSCNAGNAGTVCRSGVCDPDGKCGYANGDGPCNAGNAGTVCRSGSCSVTGVCQAAGACNVDADCTGGKWCMESTHTCTAKLPNGTTLPNDPPHTAPTLNAMCTSAAATLVCVSGVCDTDNKCGFANGDGPCNAGNAGTVCRSAVCDPDGKCGYADGDGSCNAGNAGTVCRSGACSVSGVCEPAGGCIVDGDCTGGNWCMESTHTCTAKLPNGTAIPSDPPHMGPTLNATCTAAAGALVCVSGVCDTKDNECGYANGDGPCNAGNAGTVCRSGACSVSGTCMPMGGCNVDGDCATGNWCNETAHTCNPQLDNGKPVPSDPPHTSPTLDGTCSAAAGMLTCKSGVCDTKDNECGYANGDGPCDAGNGDAVCRSGICATSGGNAGKCVACVMDSQCPGPNAKCDTTTNTCVECMTSADCPAGKPVCDTATSTCVPCKGDLGSGTPDSCDQPNAPFCFLTGSMQGQCGKCSTNADCAGHTGNICDTAAGTCTSGCATDADCSGGWCNETAHKCADKVANGMPVPSDSAHTNPTLDGTCTTQAGALTCSSGVCDPKDNECGLADGDGPCASDGQCRAGTCDATTMTCGTGSHCMSDDNCKTTEFCRASSQTCTPKLPIGKACDGNNQCQGGDCSNKVCSGVIGSGNGLICAAGQPGTSGGAGGAGAFGLLLALAAVVRRRRAA